LTSKASATVFTVSADENHPAQFTTLQAAHDAASAGDTIQWYGNNYLSNPSPTFSKPLVIQGANTSAAQVINFTSGASDTTLISGKYSSITGPGYDNSGAIFNLEVRNCKISNLNHLASGSHSIVNCIINDVMGSNYNMIYSNCIFSNSTVFFNSDDSYYSQNIYLYGGNNSIVDHCIFLTPLAQLGNAVYFFSNCIFAAGITYTLCVNSNTSFDSNMFVGFSIDSSSFCGVNISPNNIMNAPDPFINASLSNLNTINFNLNPTSEGNDAASDGTDIGLYGGANAWPTNFVDGLSAPGAPIVSSLQLQNYVIGTADQLNFNAQGSIPSNE
jgi:hypothetical protein